MHAARRDASAVRAFVLNAWRALRPQLTQADAVHVYVRMHVHAPAVRSACLAAALRQAINRNVRHKCDASYTNAARACTTLQRKPPKGALMRCSPLVTHYPRLVSNDSPI